MRRQKTEEYIWREDDINEVLLALKIKGKLTNIYASNSTGKPYLSIKVEVNE